MKSRRLFSWSMAALLVAVTAGVLSCSKSGPTYPSGGGGTLELNSADIGPGGTFEHIFSTAGSFPYHCKHHAPMLGTVTVDASAAGTLVNVSIVSAMSPFSAASVKPGGKVIWTNNTSFVHTVTSN